MKKNFSKILSKRGIRSILIGVFIFSGCALPRKEVQEQSFVPKDDLVVVSLTREGLNYYSRSRFVDAEFKFRKALDVAPNAENILFNLAMTLIQENSFPDAEEILLRLLKKNPQSTKVMAALAQLYMAEHNYPFAQTYLKRAYQTALRWREFEKATDFARSLAVLHFMLGEEDLALCYSDSAFHLSHSSDEMCRHSKLLIAKGRADEAYSMILTFMAEKDLKKDPCLIQNLALASLADGNYDDSIKFSEIGMNLRKIEPVALSILKLIHYGAKELSSQERALKYPDSAKKISTSSQEEESDTTEKTPFEEFYDGTALSTPYALYWPLRFLEFLNIKTVEMEKKVDM
ncbi:MAG: tetratricopeptide repeat protein [Bdellovibrionota bacterium]|jgi:tetratricopeptide (TPR) repeat protein